MDSRAEFINDGCEKNDGMMVVPHDAGDEQASGQVNAVHGLVIDIRFRAGILPAVDEGTAVERGGGGELMTEVNQHLDLLTVRSVALESTPDYAAARGSGPRSLYWKGSSRNMCSLAELRQSARQSRQTEITAELLDLVTDTEALAGAAAGGAAQSRA